MLSASLPIAIPRRRSIAGWAALGLLMVLGFYVLALGMVAGCLWFSSLLLNGHQELQGIMLLVLGLVMGANFIWALFPRRDRFEPPGPRVDATSQPRLFAELESIAAQLNEPMPREVYVTAEVNAWVRERGGWMGWGSWRAMGLGLPLMRALSLSQFRAALAHEFGHYYGGDTRLAPWFYQARAAMARSLKAFGEPSSWLRKVARFSGAVWLAYNVAASLLAKYWELYLRSTLWLARRQEYRADELACAIAGPGALISGLRAIYAAASGFDDYWGNMVIHVLAAGFHPPLADGFALFLSDPSVATALSQRVEQEIREPRPLLYDTHPSLRDRIAVAQRAKGTAAPEGSPPAIELLQGVPTLEKSLLQMMYPQARVSELQPVPWEALGECMVIPQWRSFTREYADLLAGLTVESLPDLPPKLREISSRIPDPKGRLLTREQRAHQFAYLLTSAVGLAMVDRGWRVDVDPGHNLLRRGELSLDPYAAMRDIVTGKLTREAWAAQCKAAGIEGMRLDAALPPAEEGAAVN